MAKSSSKSTVATPLPKMEVVNVDAFQFPKKEHKYPWASMTDGQIAIFGEDESGLPDTDYARITRAVTAHGKKSRVQFAVRKLPPGTKIGERTLTKGGLAVQRVGARTPKVAPAPIETTQEVHLTPVATA